MNEDKREILEQQLDAYLDGLLSPEERAAFERQIATDAALRARLEVQRRIDAALPRIFTPSGEERVLARLETALLAAPRPALKLRRSHWTVWGRWAAAAVFVLAVGGGGGWMLGRLVNPRRPDPYEWRSLQTVYHDEIATGFQPSWTCKNDREFATIVWKEKGQPLLLKPADDVKAVGWSYSNNITDRTMQLLTRVQDKNVIVFVDQASAKPKAETFSLSFWSGLHLFSKQIGSLQVYELSPLEKSHVLDLLYQPDVSEEWLRGAG